MKTSLNIPAEASDTGRRLLAVMRAADATTLQTEYVRLFINAVQTLPCPPYGSFYPEGSLQGRSCLQVTDIYDTYGLTCEEMADHIGVETAFLSLMLAARPLRKDSIDDCRFLAGHLDRWAPHFFALVREHDRLGIYAQGTENGDEVLRELLRCTIPVPPATDGSEKV